MYCGSSGLVFDLSSGLVSGLVSGLLSGLSSGLVFLGVAVLDVMALLEVGLVPGLLPCLF